MSLDELQEKRRRLKRNSDITFENVDKIANESYRVADVAHNSKQILDDLDREFEEQTGLKGKDMKFLFAAIALQVTRIILLNKLTRLERAGGENRNEKKLHEFQEKLLGKFNPGELMAEAPYYASLEHIISRPGVPYDATATLTEKSILTMMGKGRTWDFDLAEMIPNEKISLFKGANHRFSTLGHDPIIGLVFGTGNIMTNTITCVNKPIIAGNIGLPILTTNHVAYTADYKDPRIATYGSTVIMLQKMVERTLKQPEAFVASLIKQIIHIGTDLYTPCGIQIPGANLLLSNQKVEELTSYVYSEDTGTYHLGISTGDIVKIGMAMGLAKLINMIISTLHTLMYDPASSLDREIYNVKKKKIILYSNMIASTSNVIASSIKAACSVDVKGKVDAIREFDIGGILVTVNHLVKDPVYIRQIKEEFVRSGFIKRIRGEDLKLDPVIWE